MPYTIRELTEADDPRRAELLNLGAPEPVTVETLRAWRQNATPGSITWYAGAQREDGFLAGYTHAVRTPWLEPGLFWLHIAVDPAWRRQGIGSQLCAAALEFARAHGATTYRAEVRDSFPQGLEFAARHDFRVERHIFESVLDLAHFDEMSFAGRVERLRAAGIRFFTLADLGDTREARERLHALERATAADVPGGSEATTRSFEDYEREVHSAVGFRAEAQFIAAEGEQWIGLAGLEWLPNHNGAYNMLTGVRREARGRGIATALKLLIIAYARQHGAAYLRTNNDSENAPMLAINRALGYQPEPGYSRMRRDRA